MDLGISIIYDADFTFINILIYAMCIQVGKKYYNTNKRNTYDWVFVKNDFLPIKYLKNTHINE